MSCLFPEAMVITDTSVRCGECLHWDVNNPYLGGFDGHRAERYGRCAIVSTRLEMVTTPANFTCPNARAKD